MATFSDEQFATLLAQVAEVGAQAGARAGAAAVAQAVAALPAVRPEAQLNGGSGAAALVGQVPPCQLGKNKLKRYKKWRDWIKDCENKMTFMGITDDGKKISFIRSCAGPELTEFWDKEARIRFTAVPEDIAHGIPAQAAHTYEGMKTDSTASLLKYVNKDRAIIDLLRLEQGGRSFTEFLAEVEEQEYLCRIEEAPMTSADLQRMSLIAGITDRTLAEKALAEEYSLKQLITAALNRESSRANVEAMKARPTASVSNIESKESDNISAQLREIRADLSTVMRVKQNGKYSRRYKPPDDSEKQSSACAKCTYTHESGRCPADGAGRTCNTCGVGGHFSYSSLCKKSKKKPKFRTMRVEVETSESEYESEPETVSRIERIWPGVQAGTTRTEQLKRVKPEHAHNSKSKRVTLVVGGTLKRLFYDTGSKFTIIPPEEYRRSMGRVVPAECHLRAWGSDTNLDVKGMFRAKLEAARGAQTDTWVYVVAGTRPEPLLGEKDAEELGIITFDPAGRSATEEDVVAVRKVEKASIPAKLRRAGITVNASKPALPVISKKGKQEAQRIADVHTGAVLSTRTGCMKVKPIKLQYEEGFHPSQPPRYPVPYHYRERLSAHLSKLKAEDIIEDVDPAERIDCVLNVTISDKKTLNEIRMNIDARPINLGAKHTKYHITTPQEIRHELDGATIFTELDMVNGFHQVPLDESSQIVFQTHEGLHRMKRLFFGPKNSSGIFHHEVKKIFSGVPGCITIHDNILVYGKGPNPVEDHNRNLLATLKRAKQFGITFKENQYTICSAEVKWFGRIFSGAGVSADPEKINIITEAGRPESIADVKSLLQAAAYNAKFAFDHQEGITYEEATAPLRELLTKDAHFTWNEQREESYQRIIRMMSDKSILAPFKQGRATHLVTDASPHGISASLYQTDENGCWLPIDHLSRALSEHEKAWKSQIEWESLAKMWGMTAFRPYLVGTHFTSWGDQKPLVPLYNELTRNATARINKHRSRILDLSFTDKYLPGSRMPADYLSRHPSPITGLSSEERAAQMIDDGEDVHVMRVVMADLPPALTLSMLRDAAAADPVYQRLIRALEAGKKPSDPDMTPYTSIWTELSIMEGLVCRGERIVIPNGRLPTHDINMREWVVDLGHSGHMGMSATKRLLRLRLWFPGMDRMVERIISECLPCQASIDNHTRDPLKPTPAPKSPWDKLYCDHWGPTQDGNHMLVLVDALTRYPEVLTVHGTGAEDNIHAFSECFARHGYPSTLHSDNGPPFNYSDNSKHLLGEYFKSVGVTHYTNISAEDPEATGLVEAFMKHIKKVFHTCAITGEDPYLKIHDHLVNVRATPHPTTGKSPAELLFGRKFRIKLPDIREDPAESRPDIIAARKQDQAAKACMKVYKDARCHAKPHTIRPGNKVLLKRKTSKHISIYDPSPYTVTEIHGTQIAAERDGVTKVRDAQRWKKVVTANAPRQYNRRSVQESQYQRDPDIGAGSTNPAGPAVPPLAHPVRDEPGPAPLSPVAQRPAPAPEVNPEVIRRWRRNPDIILSETLANRPKRNPKPIERLSYRK